MTKAITSIYLSIEQEEKDAVDYDKDHTDVIVVMDSGEKFAASFFAFENIALINEQNKLEGEYLGGLFFWTPNMLLIESCSREMVETVIQYLMEEGDFEAVFKKI